MDLGTRKACPGIQTMEISAEEGDLLSLTTLGALGKGQLRAQCFVASEVVALCCSSGEWCGENVWNQVL